jgi:hypothetical protein
MFHAVRTAHVNQDVARPDLRAFYGNIRLLVDPELLLLLLGRPAALAAVVPFR